MEAPGYRGRAAVTLRLVVALVAIATAGCASFSKSVALLPSQRDNYRADVVFELPPHELRGVASWFGQPGTSKPAVAWYTRPNKFGKPFRFYAAAGPALREFLGQPSGHFYRVHYRVLVTNEATNTTIVVDVVDWCGCRGRAGEKDDKAIDLSPAAFEALGVPLSRGVQRVVIKEMP